MPDTELEKLVSRGIRAVDNGKTATGLECLEKAVRLQSTPANWSYYAVCLARERKQVKQAMTICLEAMKKDPTNPVHYLNLGRIKLIAGEKTEAIHTFRQGLLYGTNPLIIHELNRLGTRKQPVFHFLNRGHLLNRITGRILHRLGLR